MTAGAKRVVVTGAAGFIGSTLVERLLREGWTVAGIDAFDPFYPREVKLRNVRAAAAHPDYRLYEADTTDRERMRGLFDEIRPSVVVDLAARGGVRPSLADPEPYIRINVIGLKNTLDAAASVDAKIVFASSSSVYGDDPVRPFVEDQMRCRPESPYGATKIAAEALVNAHRSATGLPAVMARLFTVYGPRQRPDLAIHKFARRLLDGDPIELYDEGRAVRDYTYVDDVVDAFVRLIETDEPDLLVNIGSHRPIETAKVVDELEASLGVTAERVLLPAQPGDVPATFADTSRARERLGWYPRWEFEAGIASFSRWLRESEAVAVS